MEVNHRVIGSSGHRVIEIQNQSDLQLRSPDDPTNGYSE
jgi:hypothetical protein